MSYILEEQFTSKNFTPAAQCQERFLQPRVIKGITIHHWGSLGQNFNTVRDFLCTNNTPTSAHFVAQDGLVSCIVTPADVAWHAGNAEGNATTIGIECRPEATDGDYQTVAELVAWLWSQHGVSPLYHHSDWVSTDCPGAWDLERLYALAQTELAKLNAPSAGVPGPAVTTPAPAPAPAPPAPVVAPQGHTAYVPDLHWEVERGDYIGKIAEFFHTDAGTLARYNGIANPDLIRVGEWIWPPTGHDTWTVDPGDTLTKIAASYPGVTVDAICNANGINDPNQLAVGQRLQIP